MQRGDQVLLGNSTLGKVHLHQLVFAFGHQFHQRLMGCFGLGGQAGRDFAGDLAAAVAPGGVMEGLHRHQIDHAMKALGVRDGQLHGHAIPAPAVAHIVNQGA